MQNLARWHATPSQRASEWHVVLGALAPELHVGQVEEPAVIVHQTTADQATRRGEAVLGIVEELARALGVGGGTPAAQIAGDRGVQVFHCYAITASRGVGIGVPQCRAAANQEEIAFSPFAAASA